MHVYIQQIVLPNPIITPTEVTWPYIQIQMIQGNYMCEHWSTDMDMALAIYASLKLLSMCTGIKNKKEKYPHVSGIQVHIQYRCMFAVVVLLTPGCYCYCC